METQDTIMPKSKQRIWQNVLAILLLALTVQPSRAMAPAHNFSNKSLTALLSLLDDHDPQVRCCAAMYIGFRYADPSIVSINGPEILPGSPAPELPIPKQTVENLAKRAESDDDLSVRLCALMALKDLSFRTNTIPILETLLNDKVTLIRIRAAEALSEISSEQHKPLDGKVVTTLIDCLKPTRHEEELWQAAYAVQCIGPEASDTEPALKKLQRHKSKKVRQYAATALRSLAGKEQSRSGGLRKLLLELTTYNQWTHQRLLREASHRTQDVALNREWRKISSVLKREGLQQVSARDNQYTIDYRYLVTEKAWTARDGNIHKMYLDFSVDKRSTNDVPAAKPGCVIDAKAVLAAEVNQPISKFALKGTYETNSAAFQVIQQPEVAEAAKTYPILQQVEISYGYLKDWNFELVPQGFSVHLELRDPSNSRHGKGMFYTVSSQLDDLEDWHGKRMHEHFEPRDTLFAIMFRGSNEWSKDE